ncbi:MAG: ParB/RepB/Spo0J family partition protein [Oscillospiraceae bacterium]|nr:ParB/RepB/Spo0J family partition protein [Oscillospiraceae bacterium]
MITVNANKLKPFKDHPYQVNANEDMDRLVESIKEKGVLTPLIIRPLENTDEFEVISGHRRLYAAQKAGITELPAFVHNISRDEAVVEMVDSNIQRENILPSEKAKAYKMKNEALKRTAGRPKNNSRQVGENLWSVSVIAEDAPDSERQIQRYIRLTNLIPEFLEKVDEEKIALTPAVEISYLSEQQQYDLLETMESEDCTPSLSQAQQMKKLSQQGNLDMDSIFRIMSQPKANQKEKISFEADELRKYFPKSYTDNDIKEALVSLAAQYKARKSRDRDSR